MKSSSAEEQSRTCYDHTSCATTRSAHRGHGHRLLRHELHSRLQLSAVSSFTEPVPRFQAALNEAYAAGTSGKNLKGSGINVDLHMFVAFARRVYLR